MVEQTAFDTALSACLKGMAAAFDQVERKECPHLLLDAIKSAIPFQFALMVVHQRDERPVHIADTFTRSAEKRALAFYLDSTYILNPVYNAYLNGLKEGVYRMRELAPDNYFSSTYYSQFKAYARSDEEIGYKTFGWPAGMEELIITSELPHGKMAELSLSRAMNSGGWQDGDCYRLRTIMPLVSALCRRLWQNFNHTGISSPSCKAMDIFLHAFDALTLDGKRLSRRECEVAQLILQGHSSHSISQHLQISLTTVKTHRRNLYAKLSISTQQELFAAFLTSLPIPPLLPQ